MASIFREAALKRLSAPEQLDRALHVVRPGTWLALTMLALILAATVVWSFEGEVSTYVRADGILVNQGGTVVDAASSIAATLTRIVPEVGDRVEQGQVVGETADEEAAERYRSASALVEERERALADTRAALEREDEVAARHLERQRERLRQLEDASRKLVATAEERLRNHRELFEDHIVTRVTVERSQEALDRARRELFALLRERDELDSNELQRRNARDARLTEEESRVEAARRRMNELGAEVEAQRIVAPASGHVIELKASVGAVLRPGQPILSIRTGTERLGVLMYVPPADGKQVEPGMAALVSPATLRREEYGSLRGEVRRISAFPVTRDGMLAVLQNQDLASTFARAGPPYAGEIVLELDPATASGFAWTSPAGAAEEISSGTLVSIEIRTDRQAPITLAVPFVREVFGL